MSDGRKIVQFAFQDIGPDDGWELVALDSDGRLWHASFGGRGLTSAWQRLEGPPCTLDAPQLDGGADSGQP